MGDVDTSTAVDGDFLVYDTSNSPAEWLNKSFAITVNGSALPVTRTETTSDVTIDLAIQDTTPSKHSFSGYSSSQYNVGNALRFNLAGPSVPYGTLSGDLVVLNGVFQINVTDNLTWSHGQGLNLATVPTELHSTGIHWLSATAYVKIGGLYSTINTNVTLYVSGSAMSVYLTSPTALNFTSGDIVEVAIGGLTYHKES